MLLKIWKRKHRIEHTVIEMTMVSSKTIQTKNSDQIKPQLPLSKAVKTFLSLFFIPFCYVLCYNIWLSWFLWSDWSGSRFAPPLSSSKRLGLWVLEFICVIAPCLIFWLCIWNLVLVSIQILGWGNGFWFLFAFVYLMLQNL